jgi:hypothetical protein
MMKVDDCFRLLELEPNATITEIRQAHRDLARVWHPDRFVHDPRMREKAERRMQSLNEALATIIAFRREDAPAAPVPSRRSGGPENLASGASKAANTPAATYAIPIVTILVLGVISLVSKQDRHSVPPPEVTADQFGVAEGVAETEPVISGGLAEALLSENYEDMIVALLPIRIVRRTVPPDYGYGPYRIVIFRLWMGNVGSPEVRALRGFLIVDNIFDERVAVIRFEQTVPLPPQHSIEFNVRVSVTEEQLWQRDLSDLKFRWQPDELLYADGRQRRFDQSMLSEVAVSSL